ALLSRHVWIFCPQIAIQIRRRSYPKSLNAFIDLKIYFGDQTFVISTDAPIDHSQVIQRQVDGLAKYGRCRCVALRWFNTYGTLEARSNPLMYFVRLPQVKIICTRICLPNGLICGNVPKPPIVVGSTELDVEICFANLPQRIVEM